MSEQYSQAEFLRDFDRALRVHTVPGYPSYEERLRMEDRTALVAASGDITLPYDATQPWCPADFYPTHATKPQVPGQFLDHGDVYPPTAEEARLWEEFGIRRDQRQMPVHPFAEAILLGGETPEGTFVQPGGVVTPGYYYQRGPRKTADLLLVAPDAGELHGLVIERGDNGLLAVPGGHIEAEDQQASRAMHGRLSEYEIGGMRELAEEAGMVIDDRDLTCSGLRVVLQKIWAGPGADQRATLHAWPQGEAFVGILPAKPAQQPQAASDAETARWLPLSEATLERLAQFSCHGTIGRRAIAAYEQATGTHINPDSTIS